MQEFKGNILFVTTDTQLLNSLSYLCKQNGYDTSSAPTFDKMAEFLEKLIKKQDFHRLPGAIIADFSIEEPPDPADVISWIRNQCEKCRFIPISDAKDEDTIKLFLNAGADHYVMKPVIPKSIIQALSKYDLLNAKWNVNKSSVDDQEKSEAEETVNAKADPEVVQRILDWHKAISKEGVLSASAESFTRHFARILENPELKKIHPRLARTEAYSPHLLRHCITVAAFTHAMALAAERFDENTLDELMTAAFLHDSGALLVPPKIYEKYPVSLDHQETLEWEKHALDGEKMALSAFPKNPAIASHIVKHHETASGTGYPGRVAAGELELLPGILACMNDFCILAYGAKPDEPGNTEKIMADANTFRAVRGSLHVEEVMELFDKLFPEGGNK